MRLPSGRAGLRLGASCPRLAEEEHGSWFFSLELPRHVGGTRRRIRRGEYASREEAERALGRLQVTGGRVLTVADWLEIWLATRTRVRDKTLRGYTAHVRLHLAPHLGQVLLAELHVGHLDRAFTALLRQDGVTVATAHRVLATLRSALNTAVREKLIGDSPAHYLQLPPARRPRAVVWTPRRIKEWKRTGVRPAVAVWTPAQTAQFLGYISHHWLYAAFHLIALRGLRRGEAAGLRWCDIDLDHKIAGSHRPGRAVRPDAARGPWQLRAALGEYAAHVALSRTAPSASKLATTFVPENGYNSCHG